MALRYPGSAPIPEYESSLAKFMPAFEKGQAERRDSDAFDAAAQAFGGGAGPAPEQPSSPLERLMGNLFGGQKQGPFTRPETAVAAIDAVAPPMSPTPGTQIATSDTSQLPAGYLANARSAESGGNDAAANPNSSALGRYQFLDSTWRGLMQQYPELGLTPNGRTDPAQQERAMAKFTQDNARSLSGSGIPVNPGTLYAAHFLGAGGAQKALTADPATPMSALVDPGVISANPHLQGMTAGDFAQWAQRKGGGSDGGSGGYTPPMQDVGAGQGRPFTVDESTMRTLLASEATRPLAISLIQAQQETQASQGRFVTEEGDDGAIWQRDTLTGEQKVIREAPTPPEPGFRTLSPEEVSGIGLPAGAYQVGPDNKIYEIGGGGTKVEVSLGDGAPGLGKLSTDFGYVVDPVTREPVIDPATGLPKAAPIPGSPAAIEAQKLAESSANATDMAVTSNDIVATDIDRALALIDTPGLLPTTGFGSDWFNKVGGTAGNDLRNLLNTVKANTAFGTLQAMREASPTGGALGAVTAPELTLLEAAKGAVEQSQSPQQLKDNLIRLQNISLDIVHGKGNGPARKTPSFEKGGLPEGVTEEDIEYTMQVHGLTREQVLERLNATP